MSKIEAISKVSLKLTSKINLGRWSARAQRSILDTVHKPPPPPPPHSPAVRKGLKLTFQNLYKPILHGSSQHLWCVPMSSYFRILSSLPIIFPWISANYPCTHMDKQLFAKSEMSSPQNVHVCILRKSEFKSSIITSSVLMSIMNFVSPLLKCIRRFPLLSFNNIKFIFIVRWIFHFSDVLGLPITY